MRIALFLFTWLRKLPMLFIGYFAAFMLIYLFGLGIDMALYQTTANIERKQKIGLALSLRIDRADN